MHSYYKSRVTILVMSLRQLNSTLHYKAKIDNIFDRDNLATGLSITGSMTIFVLVLGASP